MIPKRYDLNELSEIYKDWKNKNQSVDIYINPKNKTIKAVYKKSKENIDENFRILNRTRFNKMKFNKLDHSDDNSKIMRSAAKMVKIYFISKSKKIPPLTALKLNKIYNESTEMVNNCNSMLKNMVSLQRSGSGTKGVYFCKCNGYETKLAIKFVDEKEADRFVLADAFFVALGYTSSRAHSVPWESRLGICDPLIDFINSSQKPEPYDPNLIQDDFQLPEENIIQAPNFEPLPDRHLNEIKQAIESRKTILIMEKLEGSSLDQLKRQELLRYIKNDKFLTLLGEMIFIDAFIGNSDRINITSCNLGNIMVSDEDELLLIDQQFCLGFPILDGEIRNEKNLMNQIEEQRLESEAMNISISEKPQDLSLNFQLAPLNLKEVKKKEFSNKLIDSNELQAILTGQCTEMIVEKFCQELAQGRLMAGSQVESEKVSIEQTQPFREAMVKNINQGIKQAFIKLERLLSKVEYSSTRFKLFQLRGFKEQKILACDLIEILVKLNKKS